MTEEYTDEMKCIDNAIDRIDEISRLLEECRRDVGKTRCAFRLRTIRSLLDSAWVNVSTVYELESNRGAKE